MSPIKKEESDSKVIGVNLASLWEKRCNVAGFPEVVINELISENITKQNIEEIVGALYKIIILLFR